MKMQQSKLNNNRGQISIFVALIFNVLFVFFAMIINVGLLVHHKINLQNSVDLAAYYAATKQAETMNAMGHINYQIRQAWKLLNFRYRILGGLGHDGHPAKSGLNSNVPNTAVNPFFCLLFSPFRHMNVDQQENYCRDLQDRSIPLPPVPVVVADVFGIASPVEAAAAAATQAAINAALTDCKSKTALNWFTMGVYMYLYRNDIANRKRLMNKLANQLSRAPDDFKDLDGESVKVGATETFKRNVTHQIREDTNMKFNIFNSLGTSSCGSQGNDVMPPKWLSEIYSFAYFAVMEGTCTNSTRIDWRIKFTNDPAGPNNDVMTSPFAPIITQLMPYLNEIVSADPNMALYRTTLGYEKNPYCMAYVGASAEATPQIPFSPFGQVKLRASAFAKPFGGTIGPWFAKSWTQATAPSTSGDAAPIQSPQDITRFVDSMTTPRAIGNSAPPAGSASNPRLFMDHSRYVGDEAGTNSNLTLNEFGRKIIQNYPATGAGGTMNIEWWTQHVANNRDLNRADDIGDYLAFDGPSSPGSGHIRNLEIAAISPDQYDLANYMIEPDWQRNYMQRLLPQETTFNFSIRGDLGMRKGESGPWENFNIKDQIKHISDLNVVDFGVLSYIMNVAGSTANGNATHWGELLTSYKPTSPELPVLDVATFGKCRDTDPYVATDPPEVLVPGLCKDGGRLGYSVKLVNGEMLRGSTPMPIGGLGDSPASGAIINSWGNVWTDKF